MPVFSLYRKPVRLIAVCGILLLLFALALGFAHVSTPDHDRFHCPVCSWLTLLYPALHVFFLGLLARTYLRSLLLSIPIPHIFPFLSRGRAPPVV
ncbi:MAG: hypothetical protein O2954_12225 [bacterium]|nr:hypothetical protein [bacterium]